MDNDSRLTLEQEIADLRFALRQATDRASLAEVKCSQLLAASRLTDAERVALMWALATLETEAIADAGQNAEAAATLRGLLERIGGA